MIYVSSKWFVACTSPPMDGHHLQCIAYDRRLQIVMVCAVLRLLKLCCPDKVGAKCGTPIGRLLHAT